MSRKWNPSLRSTRSWPRSALFLLPTLHSADPLSLLPTPLCTPRPSHPQGERQKKATKKTGSGLSPEELLKIQEEMFAASKAKLEAGGA